MGITKREIASELGVSKRTVANYIEKLGLGNHVSRNGNTDFLDDFAAAAIADALIGQGAFNLISACRRHAGTKKDDTVPPTAANSDRAPMLPEYSSVR